MIVLGHRGGRGEGWPAENSLKAFARALAEGADGVELDVRLCATGEAVVAHDVSLARATNGADRRLVHQVRRAELPTLEGGARIPELAEALDLCHGRIVNVEIKSDGPQQIDLVREVARVIRRARHVDVVISSFDPRIVLASAAFVPDVPRGMLVGARTPSLGTVLPLALRPVVAAAHLEDALIAPRRIERLRRVGVRVAAWTVNDATRAKALATLGLAWLITDQPAAIVAAVRSNAGRVIDRT